MSLDYSALKKLQTAFGVIALMTLASAQTTAEAATFNAPAIGVLRSTEMGKDETLTDIAEKYRLGYAQVVAANPNLDPWLPKVGERVILPEWHILPDAVHQGLVINTGELRAYYFPPDGSKPKTFAIGIGREGLNTPQGTTSIVQKVKGPIWRPTPRMRQEDPELPAVVKQGHDNPMGAYALYLGWPSYRIHGTNKPKAIGRRASSGCIRMYDEEIEYLYKTLPVGFKVTSVNQPVKMAWINDEFYIEAEPSDLQIDELEYQNRQITVDIPDGIIAKVRAKAGADVDRINWEKVREVLVERTGIPTMVTNPLKGHSTEPKIVKAEHRDKIIDTENPHADMGRAPAISLQEIEKAEQAQRQQQDMADHSGDWENLNGGNRRTR